MEKKFSKHDFGIFAVVATIVLFLIAGFMF